MFEFSWRMSEGNTPLCPERFFGSRIEITGRRKRLYSWPPAQLNGGCLDAEEGGQSKEKAE